MPKVTAVELQKSFKEKTKKYSPPRFNIFLDGKFAFGADEDLVVNYRLVVGKVIEKDLLERILFDAQVGKLMDRMYGLFAIRQRSEKEVRDRLKLKNFELKVKGKPEVSDLVIDSLIERLKNKGMINDEEFARNWIEARRKSKNKGVIALKGELISKGIDKEIIEKVLIEDKNSEEDLALQALSKKEKRWKALPEIEVKKKALEFLIRKGFSFQIASNAVAIYLKKR